MILNENLFENKPIKFPKTDYYIRVKEGVELVNGKVKEFEDGIKIGIHETPYEKVASDVRTGYKIIGTGRLNPLMHGDKEIYGSKNDKELFNQAYDLLKSIDQDYYNSLPNAIDYVENLTEAKGVRGTQKGEKRGSYKKVDTESKYEKVTSEIDKQVEWITKENGKKILKKLTAYPNMKVKNEFYFDAVTPSLLEKGKAVLDKFNIDYKEEDGKVSWVFKNEDFDEINLDKVSHKTKELFREDILTSENPNGSTMSFKVEDDGTIIIYDGEKEIKRSKTNPKYAKQVLKDLGFKEKELVKESFEDFYAQFDIKPERKIKEVYAEISPEEFQLDKIHPTKTIADIWSEMQAGEDFYRIASVDGEGFDSAVREGIFEIISKAFKIPYDTVYLTWRNGGKLEEAFEDEHLGSTEKVIEDGGEIIPDSVEPGPDAGIATQLNKLIRDEWEAIQEYNDAIVMAELEGFHDVAKVFKDIVNEENVHVGQLEQCMKLVSPNADSIVHGEIEAEGQLGEEPTPVEKEDPEEGMHY